MNANHVLDFGEFSRAASVAMALFVVPAFMRAKKTTGSIRSLQTACLENLPIELGQKRDVIAERESGQVIGMINKSPLCQNATRRYAI